MSMLHQHFIHNKQAAMFRDFRRHASVLSLCNEWAHALLRGYEAQGPHVDRMWMRMTSCRRKTNPTNVFNRTDRRKEGSRSEDRDRRHVTSPPVCGCSLAAHQVFRSRNTREYVQKYKFSWCKKGCVNTRMVIVKDGHYFKQAIGKILIFLLHYFRIISMKGKQ